MWIRTISTVGSVDQDFELFEHQEPTSQFQMKTHSQALNNK